MHTSIHCLKFYQYICNTILFTQTWGLETLLSVYSFFFVFCFFVVFFLLFFDTGNVHSFSLSLSLSICIGTYVIVVTYIHVLYIHTCLMFDVFNFRVV